MRFSYQHRDNARPLSAVQKSLVLIAVVVLFSLVFELEIPHLTSSDQVPNDVRLLEVIQDDGADSKSTANLISNTVVLTHQECMQHMESNRLPNLITKLTQDPEANALVPLELDLSNPDAGDHIMKGLDLNVFRGKKIAIIGDSTLRYLSKWLYALLTELENEGGDPKYDEMALSEARAVVLDRAEKLDYLLEVHMEGPRSVKAPDGTWIEWTGIAGHNAHILWRVTEQMFVNAGEMNPDIVIANMGFHWIHLCPFSQCPGTEKMGGLMIKNWVHYRDWLQRVYDMAVKTNAKVLLFKTNNFICEDVRTNDWEIWSSRYVNFDAKTIDDCYEQNIKFADPHNSSPHIGGETFTKDQIYNFCKYGQQTEVGSKYLNQQIEEFVRDKHETDTNSTLTVGIFDDHDVQGCDTEDGIHHFPEMLMRIRLLANTIESYSECVMD